MKRPFPKTYTVNNERVEVIERLENLVIIRWQSGSKNGTTEVVSKYDLVAAQTLRQLA